MIRSQRAAIITGLRAVLGGATTNGDVTITDRELRRASLWALVAFASEDLGDKGAALDALGCLGMTGWQPWVQVAYRAAAQEALARMESEPEEDLP